MNTLKFLLFILITLLRLNFSFAEDNRVLILDKNRHARDIRIDMMLNAQDSIRAGFYMFAKDSTALIHLALMAEAKERGVKTVQLLVDGFSNEIPRPILAYLSSIGVEVGLYHPLSLMSLETLFQRMHIKYFSTDGKKMVGGSRNIKNMNFGLNALMNFIDRDLYVQGPIVKQSDHNFVRLFYSDHVSRGPFTATQDELSEAKLKLKVALNAARAMEWFSSVRQKNWFNLSAPVESIRYVSDTPESKNTRYGVVENVYQAMLNAKHSLVIETPYLMPTKKLLDFLKWMQINKPYVKITIQTNSEHSMELPYAQATYQLYRKMLFELGIEVFEYRGPQALHAKSIVIDQLTSIITSMNFDELSETNLENAVFIKDKAFAEIVLRSIEKHILNSYIWTEEGKVSMNGRPLRPVSYMKKAALKVAHCISYLLHK